MAIITRDQVPTEMTWDLEPIFASTKEWEQAFENLSKNYVKISDYKGTLGSSAENLANFYHDYLDITRQVGLVAIYAHLLFDQDTSNNEHSVMSQRTEQLLAEVNAAMSFIQPELAALDPASIEPWFDEVPELEDKRHALDKIFRLKEYTLSDAEERILALAGPILGAGSETFGRLTDTDMTFKSVADGKGETHEVTEGRLGQILESKDRTLRENAFNSLYESYQAVRNTLATTLTTQIKYDNLEASLRGFEDARHAALYHTAIPVEVHETLVEQVNEHLPLHHRYVALRKQILGVEELQPYALYTSLLPDDPGVYTFDQGKALALEALKPLGTEYVEIVQRAFQERWIDVLENKGKRGGAYSSGTYDTYPYILHNWSNTLSDVYTLVHELGHSLHSYFTRRDQPRIYGNYGIFLAEIASTLNENLLTHYLLEKSENPSDRATILNRYLDGFKGTVFRQTQFAEFEHQIHRIDQNGEALTADGLDKLYGEINQRYYGPALAKNENIAREWSRIPHFYYNYYVFQYSTGFAAATAFSNLMLSEGESAVKRYLAFLSSGSSGYPIDILKKAGVDMTTADPIRRAMGQFETYLQELEVILASSL